jgi:hypothetical protein
MSAPRWLWIGLSAVACAIATRLSAQSLSARIDAVKQGVVTFRFAARPGICGDGDGSWSSGDGMHGWRAGHASRGCVVGPVAVSLGRDDGQTVSIRTCVACAAAPHGEVDLGSVDASDAASYLLHLGRQVGGRSADAAIAGAAVADAPVSPDLRAFVLDTSAAISARKQALFWLGQSDATTRDIVAVYDRLNAIDLRRQFTFVLSQRHDDVAIGKLIDIAQHDDEMDVRRQAMFWLAQEKDPRAIAFFRSVLTR